jgi:metal-responsive CopG/Arc/MetJ family transcriptional regulator
MSTPYQQGEIATTVDEIRQDLAREFHRLNLIRGLEVRSPAFEEALAELLAASQKARLAELRVAVGTLTESTDKLLSATREGTQSAEHLYSMSRRLLMAALATFGVALATLVVAVLQVVR